MSIVDCIRAAEAAGERDEHAVAEQHAEEAVGLARALSDESGLEEALWYLSCARRLMGKFAHASIPMAELVQRTYQGRASTEFGYMALRDLIECGIHLALPAIELEDLLAECERPSVVAPRKWLHAGVLLQKSRVLCDQNDHSGAALCAFRSAAYASSASEQQGYAGYCHEQCVAKAYLDIGDTESARSCYSTILSTDSNKRWPFISAHIGLCRVSLRCGEIGSAEWHGEAALSEARYLYPLAIGYAGEPLLDAYILSGERERALQLVDELLFYSTQTDSRRRRFGALWRAKRFGFRMDTSLVQEGEDLVEALEASCGTGSYREAWRAAT